MVEEFVLNMKNLFIENDDISNCCKYFFNQFHHDLEESNNINFDKNLKNILFSFNLFNENIEFWRSLFHLLLNENIDNLYYQTFCALGYGDKSLHIENEHIISLFIMLRYLRETGNYIGEIDNITALENILNFIKNDE